MVTRTTKKVKFTIPESKSMTFSGVIDALTTGTLKEVGIFNASSGGTMFSRRVISDYVKDTDEEVRVTFTYNLSNLKPLMNVGVQQVRDWLIGNSATSPTHIAWGTGTIETSIIDTTLESELERNVNNLTTKANFTVKFTGLLAKDEPASLPVTINRGGLFNANSNGDMFIEQQYFDLNKTSRLEVQSDYTIFIR